MTEEQNYAVEADVDASDGAVDGAVDADGRLAARLRKARRSWRPRHGVR
jgi:hypothetical protein